MGYYVPPTPLTWGGVDPLRAESAEWCTTKKGVERVSAEPTKRCHECGEEYPLIFFRRDKKQLALHASSAQGYHAVCKACEQDRTDAKKRNNRWPTKASDTTRRHAEKYGMSPDIFSERYGWDVARIAHILKHASENTCCYCREPYHTMGHGPADVTMDIIDPRKEPYLETNVQPCCATCNRRKGDSTPEDWAVQLRCWRKHDRRKRQLMRDPMLRFPLWQAAAQ